ncbi:hypothetical protein V1478_006539 [Vespula squamosa]|uniref:Uncharacterized protein n=1 Tax=Vespula squamosa TaxID=30214 RepID=A0ABD2B844_VESSQ
MSHPPTFTAATRDFSNVRRPLDTKSTIYITNDDDDDDDDDNGGGRLSPIKLPMLIIEFQGIYEPTQRCFMFKNGI